MSLQEIIALSIFFVSGYLFVRWASRKAKRNKKAKVVEMDIEEFEFDSYHKN